MLTRLRQLVARALALRIWLFVAVTGPLAAVLLIFVGVYHVRRLLMATTWLGRGERVVLAALTLAGLVVDLWAWRRFLRPPDPGRKITAAAVVFGAVIFAEIMFWSAW
jgi:uncharacterized membrane protein YdcZ (DUF606 family)